MIKESKFAKSVTSFLTEYLPGHRNASANTIRSYRDTIKQLLIFMSNKYGVLPEKLSFSDFSYTVILAFLDWLEEERGISISTRNQRLAAIHSFFRYSQNEYPEILNVSQKILGIPSKRCPQSFVEHLEKECVEKLLCEPNTYTSRGLRNCTMLSVLYDGGMRVQELINLKVSDIRLLTPAIMKLTGKGDKTRIIPITSKTKKLLSIYMNQNSLLEDHKLASPLFFNSRYEQFTRPGIAYIIKKYYEMAKEKHPNLQWNESVSPHIMRHSKAMHMLDAGIPLIYIRDFLGHVNITTTEIYLRSERKIKREALEKIYPQIEIEEVPNWSENKSLITWLNDICK